MKITDVKVRLTNKTYRRLRAIASITIDGVLAINDILVLQKKDYFFIAFPKNDYAEMAGLELIAPLDCDTRQQIQAAIVGKYREVEREGATNCRTLPFANKKERENKNE